ncbi:LexA family transcriptional regulator [Chitinibacter tainanensis]|uniref:LexA family transcriptional regulator n=1 Tax=Chitinibacter tainanensis TaxID=230667 RepID=UPI00048C40BC|nr:XRE family transcriptional regulator [Chitinibacter tainanensis]
MNNSEALRQWMRHFGLSQAQLGERAGVPQPTVHRILSGDTASPRAATLRKLIDALGLSVSEFEAGPGARAVAEAAVETLVAIPVIEGFVDTQPHFAAQGLGFSAVLARQLAADPATLIAAVAPHQSMAPTIQKGDWVLIDRARTELCAGQIFAVAMDGAVMIRRIGLSPDYITLQPDNPDHSRYFAVQLPAQASLLVLGLVVWRGGTLS